MVGVYSQEGAVVSHSRQDAMAAIYLFPRRRAMAVFIVELGICNMFAVYDAVLDVPA